MCVNVNRFLVISPPWDHPCFSLSVSFSAHMLSFFAANCKAAGASQLGAGPPPHTHPWNYTDMQTCPSVLVHVTELSNLNRVAVVWLISVMGCFRVEKHHRLPVFLKPNKKIPSPCCLHWNQEHSGMPRHSNKLKAEAVCGIPATKMAFVVPAWNKTRIK